MRFDGDMPSRDRLYWRGVVLSEFDGREWSQADFFGPDRLLTDRQQGFDIDRLGEPFRYTLTMEPTHRRWLFALSTPATSEPGIRLARDSRLVSMDEIGVGRGYDIRSWLDYRLEADGLHPHRERIERFVPPGSNPETVQVARQWATETPGAEALIERLLDHFNESFVYTLEPPLLGEDPVDEFLWDTQRGFCEHFASSFAFFMRAAGHPARVIGGYLGGEVHPTSGFVTVRQYDAHAWAEVWIEGSGWVRVDPTAAVAPERIEMSLADLFGIDEGFLADSPLSLMRFREFGLINWLILRRDYLDYMWGAWVLGYDKRQSDFLRGLLGKVTAPRLAALFLVAAGVSLLPFAIAWLRNRRRSRPDPRDALVLQFCRKMAKSGLPRRAGEGMVEYAQRIAAERPRLEDEAKAIAGIYVKLRYEEDAATTIGDLHAAIRRFRRTRPQ